MSLERDVKRARLQDRSLLDRCEGLQPWEGTVEKQHLHISWARNRQAHSLASTVWETLSGLSFAHEQIQQRDVLLYHGPTPDIVPQHQTSSVVKLCPGDYILPVSGWPAAKGPVRMVVVARDDDRVSVTLGEPDYDGRLGGARGNLDLGSGEGFDLLCGLDSHWSIRLYAGSHPAFVVVCRLADQPVCGWRGPEFKERAWQEAGFVDSFRGEFVETSMNSISGFLDKAMLEGIVDELSSIDPSRLEMVYPMNVRRHRWFRPLHGHQACIGLLEYVQSRGFIEYLESITGLDLVGFARPARIRHIGPGDYQILHDEYAEPCGLDMILTLHASSPPDQACGATVYVVEESEVVAEVGYAVNSLFLAYRTEGCVRFTRLVGRDSNLTAFQLVATFSVAE